MDCRGKPGNDDMTAASSPENAAIMPPLERNGNSA
jgi:hypothetical protein